MKTTWICYGLVVNSLLLFVGLLIDSSELIFPTIFFGIELVLIFVLFKRLFSERKPYLEKHTS